MKKRTLFKYIMDDAWCKPISGVTLYEDGTVKFYSIGNEDPWSLETLLAQSEPHIIKLDEVTLKKVRRILDNDKIYKIGQLDYVPDIIVSDGYVHEFVFLTGTKRIRRKIDNISVCKGEYKNSPKSAFIIDIMEEIGKVLCRAGVEKACFQLERGIDV